MPIKAIFPKQIPGFFQYLLYRSAVSAESVLHTMDGFFLLSESVATILSSCGIDTFPDRENRELLCRNFFDDWFLFAVCDREAPVYGLLKMREQEHDKEGTEQADGDTPGVTVSFVAFNSEILKECMVSPNNDNRKKLGIEINRVVAYPKQNHHPILKEYFIRPEADASYLIADAYVSLMASFSQNGSLPVPEAYLKIFGKRGTAKRYARIPDFLDQNNRDADRMVCDHQRIYISDPEQLTQQEKLAILVTHTGNVSVHSFAAEVRYHAMFLSGLSKIRLPLLGSPYASAIRADMSIADKEFQGPTPYYTLSSKLVREQMLYHSV